MTSLTVFATINNTLSAGFWLWLLICGGASVVATVFFLIICRVGASISDVPVDGESL